MKIGLGTAAIGRPQYINVQSGKRPSLSLDEFRSQGIAVLDRAYEIGVRYFDTAPGYGMAEDLLIKWLADKNDASIDIATKWGYTYVANFDPQAKIHEVKEHSLAKLNEQWSRSRELPFLNLYQIHSATLNSGVLENVAIHQRLFELKEKHQIRIGITSTGVDQNEIIKRAVNIQVEGQRLIDAVQATYNVYDQRVNDVASEINSLGVDLIMKEALANGRLFQSSSIAYSCLMKLAKNYQVGIDAIALRFCQQTIQPSVVLSGASNIVHLESNLEALNIELSEADIEMLKKFKMSTADYWDERKKLVWN